MNIPTLIIIGSFLSCVSAIESKMVKQMSVVSAGLPFSNDFGVFTNCGKSAISGTWSPKDISSHGEVTVNVTFTVPYDMDGGYAEVDVYKHSDGSVVAEYGSPFDCNTIKQWIPCPLTKGKFINIQKTIPDLSALADYQGVFDIVVLVSNDDDQQMLCLNATVLVSR